MQPTDTSQPDYFHKVVDCQWACPAHTDVPEYIRLIAQGRFTDAYMVNRHSNVFPGILGRVCDRPCEPACRRGRVEENRSPYAGSSALLPTTGRRHLGLPKIPNSRRQEGGADRCRLRVADRGHDLMPLGYSVTIFEQGEVVAPCAQYTSFRLPAEVSTTDRADRGMGVTLLNHPVKSLKELLTKRLDAGSSAPGAKGQRNSNHAAEAPPTSTSASPLESAFEHIAPLARRC
jgi:hypothetical protein